MTEAEQYCTEQVDVLEKSILEAMKSGRLKESPEMARNMAVELHNVYFYRTMLRYEYMIPLLRSAIIDPVRAWKEAIGSGGERAWKEWHRKESEWERKQQSYEKDMREIHLEYARLFDQMDRNRDGEDWERLRQERDERKSACRLRHFPEERKMVPPHFRAKQ
jgi:hypothetical protein